MPHQSGLLKDCPMAAGMNKNIGNIPDSVDDISLQYLNRLVADMHPDASIESFEILEERRLGKMASTAGRVKLSLRYAAGSPPLPTQVLAKAVLDAPPTARFLGETEIRMYRHILPALKIELPKCLGADLDPATGRFFCCLRT